jgi:hypothetical protein
MTQSDHPKPILDNSFSAFIAGLTVGIAGALLLGTEEGKKVTQKAIQSIPEDLTKLFSQNDPVSSPPPPQVTPSPDSYLNSEPPPPPPPPTKPFDKPSPTFFSS